MNYIEDLIKKAETHLVDYSKILDGDLKKEVEDIVEALKNYAKETPTLLHKLIGHFLHKDAVIVHPRANVAPAEETPIEEANPSPVAPEAANTNTGTVTAS